MALQDILNAIIAQTDRKIAELKTEHQAQLKQIRANGEQKISTMRQEVTKQREQKEQSMIAKAQSHINMLKKNAELDAKQEGISAVYANVLTALKDASDKDCTPLLENALKNLPADGTIIASKKHQKLLSLLAKKLTVSDETIDSIGGFLYVTDTQEFDFTFEHLVETQLRPATEMNTYQALFS